MKAAVLYDVHTPLKIEEFDAPEVTQGMVKDSRHGRGKIVR